MISPASWTSQTSRSAASTASNACCSPTLSAAPGASSRTTAVAGGAPALGHFLMEWHVPSAGNGFLCSKADLRETRKLQLQQKQESEANRFAIERLAPPALFDAGLSADPDLRDAARLRTRLDISLEATVRRMIDRRPERLGAIFSKAGVVRYCDRSREFPFITCKRGHSVPQPNSPHSAEPSLVEALMPNEPGDQGHALGGLLVPVRGSAASSPRLEVSDLCRNPVRRKENVISNSGALPSRGRHPVHE